MMCRLHDQGQDQITSLDTDYVPLHLRVFCPKIDDLYSKSHSQRSMTNFSLRTH